MRNGPSNVGHTVNGQVLTLDDLIIDTFQFAATNGNTKVLDLMLELITDESLLQSLLFEKEVHTDTKPYLDAQLSWNFGQAVRGLKGKGYTHEKLQEVLTLATDVSGKIARKTQNLVAPLHATPSTTPLHAQALQSHTALSNQDKALVTMILIGWGKQPSKFATLSAKISSVFKRSSSAVASEAQTEIPELSEDYSFGLTEKTRLFTELLGKLEAPANSHRFSIAAARRHATNDQSRTH